MVVSTLPLFIFVFHTTKVQKKVLGNQKDRHTFCGGVWTEQYSFFYTVQRIGKIWLPISTTPPKNGLPHSQKMAYHIAKIWLGLYYNIVTDFFRLLQTCNPNQGSKGKSPLFRLAQPRKEGKSSACAPPFPILRRKPFS